jgi:hypothetical protein
MPTRNRRRFVPQAVSYFLRQDYPNRELVVIDDGEDPVADVIPDDPRVRYHRLESVLPIGRKRNLACDFSRGDVIAHWDDDDWMSSDRLSRQVADLLRSETDLCGAQDLTFLRPQAGEAWFFRGSSAPRPWLAGGTLMYRRSAWATHPFAEVTTGEDRLFCWGFQADRIYRMPDSSFYIGLLHSGNSTPRNLMESLWERLPLAPVASMLAADLGFYASVRSGWRLVAANRTPISPVCVAGLFMVYEGYGAMAELLALGIERAGAEVQLWPLGLDRKGLSTQLQEILGRGGPDRRSPLLFFAPPSQALDAHLHYRDVVVSTMWENNVLPPSWRGWLNQANAVIVPCRANLSTFREAGVEVPITVVPQGIDPSTYHYQERSPAAGLTTLMVGPLCERKNTDIGIQAWQQAFADDADARLLLKARFGSSAVIARDSRIQLIDTTEKTRGIAHWYGQADVLMALGSEGFGLPAVEAMACGLPVILLDSEGQHDLSEDAGDLVLSVLPERMDRMKEAPYNGVGLRGVPGVEAVAARLRWVAEHRDEARALGLAASEWTMRNRNIWTYGPASLAVMEAHIRPARRLRRSRYLCGLDAEGVIEPYMLALAAGLPFVDVCRDLPDVREARLVHIQLARSKPAQMVAADSEQILEQFVERARALRVPIVFTEHSVDDAGTYQGGASALVALTAARAEELRQRWPATPVHHIPHGCPTWFPRRQRRRGRAVAMSRAAAVRARQGGGLRSKRALTYSPEEVTRPFDLACRLAAGADLVVVDGELGQEFEVRVVLASGVPVLVTGADSFPDLGGAVHRASDLDASIAQLLEDSTLRNELVACARDHCHQNNWFKTAERHLDLWRSLEGT